MTEHYFSANPGSRIRNAHDVKVIARGRNLTLRSADRVFSREGLDLGTAQLLDQAPELPQTGTFLDLGCGWGPIALTMGLDSPAAEVWAVDVNEHALSLTEKNAVSVGAKNVLTFEEGAALKRAAEEKVRFDVIWSNPPIRVGKAKLQQILLQWLPLLSKTGVAYLVVSKNLGADSLSRWLLGQGFPTERIASKKGYRILKVSPKAD